MAKWKYVGVEHTEWHQPGCRCVKGNNACTPKITGKPVRLGSDGTILPATILTEPPDWIRAMPEWEQAGGS